MKEKLITTFKEYKETYQTRLENHLAEYDDFDELHFIESELEFYGVCKATASVSEHKLVIYNEEFTDYEYKFLNNIEAEETIEGSRINCRTENYYVKKLIKDDHLFLTDYYNLKICEQLKYSFNKIIEFLQELQHNKSIEEIKKSTIISEFINKESDLSINKDETNSLKTHSKLKWHGTDLQFTELVQALILSDMIGIGQDKKVVFDKMRDFFGIDTFNHSDKIRDIKNREKENAKFINLLETNINKWVKSKD